MEAFVHQVKGSQRITTFGFTAARLGLPPGAWVVFAKADLTNVGPIGIANGIECRLVVASEEDKIFSVISLTPDVLQRETIALNLGVTVLDEGEVRLNCFAGLDNSFVISNITISAIGVDTVHISTEQGEEDTHAAAHYDFWRRLHQG